MTTFCIHDTDTKMFFLLNSKYNKHSSKTIICKVSDNNSIFTVYDEHMTLLLCLTRRYVQNDPAVTIKVHSGCTSVDILR